jgi:hypothetical protein
LKLEEDIPQRIVVRIELHLARAVEEDVVVAKLLEAFLQPLKVVLQLLECVENAAVGTQLVFLHDVLKLDEGPNVQGDRVVGVVVRWVEVHNGARTPDGAHKLMH